jgi:hypothetical protein
MDRSIRIVRQLEQVFQPYRMTFKELNEKKVAVSHRNVSAKKRKTLKILKPCFLGGGRGSSNFRGSLLFAGVLKSNLREKR